MPVSIDKSYRLNRAPFCKAAALALIYLVISGCNGGQDIPNGEEEDVGLDTGVEDDVPDTNNGLDASDEDSSAIFDASDADGEQDTDDIAIGDADVESDDDGGGDADSGDDQSLYVEGDPPQGMEGLEILGADEEDEEMQPLSQGEVLTWEQGLQGGFHVWGSFRATGGVFEDWSDATDEDLDSIVQHYEVLDEEGELLATTNRIGFAETIEDGVASSTRFTVILRRSIAPEETVDEGPFEFVIRVEMPDNKTYESRVWVYFDCCHFL